MGFWSRVSGLALSAVIAATVVAAGLAGCSSSTTAPTVGANGFGLLPLPRHMTRTCVTAVGGSLPSGWQSSSIHSGALTLFSFGQALARGRESTLPPSDLRPIGDVKMLALVRPGSVVTMSVPPDEHTRLALAYAVGQSPTAVAGGYRSTTFVACNQPSGAGSGAAGWTQFNGGLVAAGPQCATLEVHSDQTPRQEIVLALGTRHC